MTTTPRLDACLIVTMVVTAMTGAARQAEATALDDYIAGPDPNFGWSVVNAFGGSGYTCYVLDMTSQTWRDEPNEVDRELWRHWVKIVRPTTVSSNVGLLWISGGSNGGSVPGSVNSRLVAIAKATETVCAELRMVPNQPIRFADETDPRYISGGRYEDELIAFAWDQYLRGGDATWLPRLPMTNASVLAMDAITAFCATGAGGFLTVDAYVVTGASKRGWTTWTTGAADPRVVAMIPVVIDLVNVEVSMTHHVSALTYWAPAIQDYVDMDIMGWFGTPELAAMFSIVDPYAYRSRYTMPKFIINASGDDFFLPDSSQFYYDDLPGEKHLQYFPNADHGLHGTYLPESLQAYYTSIVDGTPRPEYSWTLEPDGSIRVETGTTPTQVKLWQATNAMARDFRKNPVLPGGGSPPYSGPVWTSTTLSDQGGGVYQGGVSTPASGWSAFFIELTFPSGGPVPFVMTTEVRVVPEATTLTVDVTNAGMGRVVEVDPNWPRYYRPDDVVTLTAEAEPDRAFKHWQVYDPNHPDDANYATLDSNTVIALAMATDRHVVAVFKCGSSGALPMLGAMAGALLMCAAGRFVRRVPRRGREQSA